MTCGDRKLVYTPSWGVEAKEKGERVDLVVDRVEHGSSYRSAGADWVSIALGIVAVHLCLWLSMRFAGVLHRHDRVRLDEARRRRVP